MAGPQPERLDWLADGSPYSPRFGDRYHSSQEGGLAQALGSFVQGCDLPRAWAQRPQWRVLETGFGLGLNFLATWQAWREDPQRCAQLHFISTEAYPVDAAALLAAASARYRSLLPLAQQLAAQYVDMEAGVHRLSFERGRVHLTLAIGDARESLRRQSWLADSVYLDGFGPAHNPEMWSLPMLQALARCCIPGHTRLASWCVARSVREALAQCGFAVERVPGTPPKKHNLRALYAPREQALRPPATSFAPSAPSAPQSLALPDALRHMPGRHCIVIGAGLAGASTARAMAERGWQVTVLERADDVAQGASALPAGLFAPHLSPDDAPLSRLSRAGVRCTHQSAASLLTEGVHWQPSGVLEHRIGKRSGLPAAAVQTETGASRLASHAERCAAGLDAPQRAVDVAQTGGAEPAHPAVLHTRAGWLRPAALVRALLAHPGITVHTRWQVCAMEPLAPGAAGCLRWQVLGQRPDAGAGAQGQERGQTQGQVMVQQADCVIIAAAYASLGLLATSSWAGAQARLPVHAVRGQLAWGVAGPLVGQCWPAWPVNGKGALVAVPVIDVDVDAAGPAHGAAAGARLWVSGATFERDQPLQLPDASSQAQALQINRERLSQLLPAWGPALAQTLFAAPLQTWTGVRCTVPDRFPLYGPWLPDPAYATLAVAAGLGSRGLTLACLCAQILVAQWHEEPLPVSADLAARINARRFAAKTDSVH